MTLACRSARRFPFVRRCIVAARRCLVPILVVATAAPALAQYAWTDASGRKVYSDVPPAPSDKVNNLVRLVPAARSSASGIATMGAAAARPAASGTPAVAASTPSLADREMAYRKREAEAAEAEKQAADKARTEAKLASACEDSRANLRALESGMRISRVDASGERQVVADDEREQRIRDLRRDLSARC